MNKYVSLLLTLLSLTIHTHNDQPHQAIPNVPSNIDDTLRELCQPVKTTAIGFTHFLQHTYNNPLYAQEIIPNDFSHVIQFLEHGKNNKQPRAYAQSVLRLFSKPLRASSYVNNYALRELTRALPHLLEGYFLVQRTDVHTLQAKINQLIYKNFMHQFSPLKSLNSDSEITPDHAVFQDLSQEIIEVLHHEQESTDVTPEELRKTLLIFLEISLSKLIWGPQDAISTWNSVKAISQDLATLTDYNVIIDFDDLNGLFIALVERYCFFLDIAGQEMSENFYQELKADIASSSLLMLELEEQENYIETKKDRLQRAIERAQQERAAYEILA